MSIATITELAPTTPEFWERARWCRAGILNVHRFADAQFTFDGGRLVLRGTNGSGKSRAMDMLFPFLLSGDRRKMGSGTSGQVTIDSLMRIGLGKTVNRVGYVWAECRIPDGTYMTVGAFFRYSANSRQSNVAYFVTPLRVGHDLHLMDADRNPLPRKILAEVVGAHCVTEIPSVHRDRVAQELFGLTDDRGRARFRGYLDMLYKLRTPDIGVRIDNGEVTRLLSESLPPLSDDVLQNAGQQLDGLTETRQQQRRLEEAAADASEALETYRRYSATVITAETGKVAATAKEATAARTYERQTETAELSAESKYRAAGTKHAALDGEVEFLSARKSGLEASQAFRDAQTMVQRERTVRALEGTATAALKGLTTSRTEVERATGRAFTAAGEAELHAARVAEMIAAASAAASSAGLPSELPSVSVTVTPVAVRAISARSTIYEDEVEQKCASVPSVHFGVFTVTEIIDRLRDVADAGKARQAVAYARLTAATGLESDAHAVQTLERQAGDAALHANDAASAAISTAGDVETERERLAERWAQWAKSADTLELLGQIGWDASPVNLATLGIGDLDALDRLAETLARPAQVRLHLDEADVNTRDMAARDDQLTLTREQESLEADHDQPPAANPWVTVEDGTPFWSAVDFTGGVPGPVQAAVETALHTSGILTGTLTAAGISPANGQLLVSAFGPEATNPITRILTAETGSGIDEVALAVLTRIGYNDPTHPVNINEDGSWQVGIASGRPPSIVGPNHIGASARAGARRTRITRIGELLIELADTRAALTADRQRLLILQGRTDALVAAAPSSGSARRADASAHAAAVAADRALADRREKDSTAESARSAWDDRYSIHRQTCNLAGLPTRSSDLREVTDRAREAVGACGTASSNAFDFARTLKRFTDAANDAHTAELHAAQADDAATQARIPWVAALTELEQMRDSAGLSVQKILDDISAVERDLGQATANRKTVAGMLPTLAAEHATAKAASATATERVSAAHTEMLHAANRLSIVLRLPGVLEAAAGVPATAPPVTDIDSVLSLITWITSTVPRRNPVTADAMHTAVDALRERVAPTFDVNRQTREGVLIIELIDSDGTQTLTAAATAVAEQSANGREALLASEHDVFLRFIIGGVAAELRRSISLAEQTIQGTNDRVASYRTSNNIGVRLKFSPDETLGVDLARIRALVAIADEIRTNADTGELTRLLRGAVDAVYNDNPAGGYVSALITALDYRKWFTVDAIVLGPAEGQQRALRRAGLSSGELRYVSYLTLICALDAHMTALPAIAPRLLLLDDAFAMVDDHGRRNLLKILVGRDIDFVMTGHDLWLAFPEVKGLDLYDIIATGEDNPATTVHYHWDGRQRSLRMA